MTVMLRGWVIVAVAVLGGCEKAKTGLDLSTPRGAAITFTRALQNGDAQTALAASQAGGIERDLVEAMAQSSSGLERLEKASRAKFGDDAKRLEALRGSTNIVELLTDGEVDESPTIATVTSKDGHDALQLHKIDGQWKVDIGALIRGQDVSQAVPMFKAAGIATRKVADDIDSGKCKSMDAAITEVAGEINAHMPGRHQSRPAPATTVSDEPAQFQ